MTITPNIILDDNTAGNPLALFRRPYDATKGDARKFTFAEALTLAEERASETSVRQVITTLDVAVADANIIPRYLIQAI